MHSEDLKSDHSKTGKLQNFDFLKVGFLMVLLVKLMVYFDK